MHFSGGLLLDANGEYAPAGVQLPAWGRRSSSASVQVHNPALLDKVPFGQTAWQIAYEVDAVYTATARKPENTQLFPE